MKVFWHNFFMFIEGGLLYSFIEVCWKGGNNCSWTMAVVGGLCFIIMGLINKICPVYKPLWLQQLEATVFVLILEFLSGLLLNVWLKLNIWDYSNLKFNIMGQVCLLYSGFWYILSFVGILLDDFLRWVLFKEDKPYYNFFTFTKRTDCKKLFYI